MWGRSSSHGSRRITWAFLALALLLCCLSPAFCSEEERDPAEMTDTEILTRISELYKEQGTKLELAQGTLETLRPKLEKWRTDLAGYEKRLREQEKTLTRLSFALTGTQTLLESSKTSLRNYKDDMDREVVSLKKTNGWLLAGIVLTAVAGITLGVCGLVLGGK